MPRPNVLWLMSDQHHAACMGHAGRSEVRTPNLDGLAARGVAFTRGYCNNPICAPSRISFLTGQYVGTHQFWGNYNTEWAKGEADTLPCLLRREGWQTALVGKSHTMRRWDADGFGFIRYTDLIDASSDDPTTCHYFQHLVEHGLADLYEEGSPRPGMEYTLDGSAPARLPYRHSIEAYTGDQSVAFLRQRDRQRPFFLKASFQRPHAPIAPAREHFDLYDPDAIPLPDNACDLFTHRFAGKPAYMRAYAESAFAQGPRRYPLADPDPRRLRRCLASYYALISAIDGEIGRILAEVEAQGELDNTIIFYTADHGDFAGEHGLFHKNFGIFEAVHRIP